MSDYEILRNQQMTEPERKRSASNLLTLRQRLRASIPAKTIRDTLLLATWNIRNFDSNMFGHGPRIAESFHYIAEIISSFDLVAVQEVNEDLTPLQKVISILGPHWNYIATDKTEGPGGNGERMVFIFDTRKVSFEHVAGEIVLPDDLTLKEKKQFARTPFVVSFRAGSFRFNLCTVHIFYGEESGDDLEKRIMEIDSIAKFLARRNSKDMYNYILLGDFNIVSPEHATMAALLKNGFMVPPQLKHPSNIDQTKYYDQIAFKTEPNELRLGDSPNNAGVFNFYETLYRDGDYATYIPYMDVKKVAEKKSKKAPGAALYQKYFETWKTFQMSDHLPMWVELKIDFSEDVLKEIAGAAVQAVVAPN